MKTVTQSPARPFMARTGIKAFGWVTRIVLWLIIGNVTLAAIGAAYQTIAAILQVVEAEHTGQSLRQK